jgi:hypothetical protein
MVDHVGDGVGFVVTGHSHLARALRRGQTSFYYNCGTWIRLLRLTDEALAKEAFEKELWPALTNGRMSALDEALIPGPSGEKVPLLFDRTNVVRIGVVGGQVTGELLRVGDGPNGAAAVAPEPNTTPFTIG